MSNEGFFSFHSRSTRAKRAAPALDAATAEAAAMTPSQVNCLVEQTLKAGLPSTLLVKGEISNFTRNRNSGHLYFTLKDSGGALDAIMWASRAERLRFEPKDGMELLATGSIGVYVPRGRYQIVVNSLDPVGEGALELAKRQLEEKLRGEGLFDPERKRPIPLYPRTIAIVTSPQAAGFADVCKVLCRSPWVRTLIFPVPVQGADAAPAVSAALKRLSSNHRDLGGVDLVILARGGGSLEDLWAFNDESVARAIAASSIPVITGIGHDIDVSIADLVADHHAHTPTEAATYALREWIHAAETLEVYFARATREVRRRIGEVSSQLSAIARHELFRRPALLIEGHRQRLDDLEHELARSLSHRRTAALARLERLAGALSSALIRRRVSRGNEQIVRLSVGLDRAAAHRVANMGKRLDALASQLRALSPEHVLKRGYSITRIKKTGQTLRSVDQVKPGELLETRLADGVIDSRAVDPKQGELF